MKKFFTTPATMNSAKYFFFSFVAMVAVLFTTSCSSDDSNNNVPTTETFNCAVTFEGATTNAGTDAASALKTYFQSLIGSDGQLTMTYDGASAIKMSLTCKAENTESVKNALIFKASKDDLTEKLEEVKGLKTLNVDVKYVGTSMFDYTYATTTYKPFGLWTIKGDNTALVITSTKAADGNYVAGVIYNNTNIEGTVAWKNNVAEFTSTDKAINVKLLFANHDNSSVTGTVTLNGEVKKSDVKFESIIHEGELWCTMSATVVDPDNQIAADKKASIQTLCDHVYYEDSFKSVDRIFDYILSSSLESWHIAMQSADETPELKNTNAYVDFDFDVKYTDGKAEQDTHIYFYFNGQIKSNK